MIKNLFISMIQSNDVVNNDKMNLRIIYKLLVVLNYESIEQFCEERSKI